LIWSTFGSLDLRGAEPLLEVVVVWVSTFTLIEVAHRFRLGRIRWNGGSALDKLKGMTAVLTKVEVTEMKANSSQIMSGVRVGVAWNYFGLVMCSSRIV
jgi:hypothetical protein